MLTQGQKVKYIGETLEFDWEYQLFTGDEGEVTGPAPKTSDGKPRWNVNFKFRGGGEWMVLEDYLQEV